MLVSCCKVCENVDELDEDPGVGFAKNVEPQPIIAASLDLRLLDDYLSEPGNLLLTFCLSVFCARPTSPLQCLRFNEVIDNPGGAVKLLAVLVQLLPDVSGEAVELLVDLPRHLRLHPHVRRPFLRRIVGRGELSRLSHPGFLENLKELHLKAGF